MTVFFARLASTERNVLAEGPVWVAERQRLLWLDVARGIVFEGDFDAGRVEETARHQFDGMVGAAVMAADGRLLVAGERRLVVLSPSGERREGPRIVDEGARRRTNDGGCDPSGRFLVGTLSLDDRIGGETLSRIEDDGHVTVLDDDLSLSNGLAWSPDGSRLYSTDSTPGVVWVRDYDAATGMTGERVEHLRITDGSPDGLCVDDTGRLWIAVWGAGEVRSFTVDGRHADTVEVPAPHVSSVAFVGPALDTLLITTASRDLTAAEQARYPDAGRLFVAEVGVAGVPTTLWSGRPDAG